MLRVNFDFSFPSQIYFIAATARAVPTLLRAEALKPRSFSLSLSVSPLSISLEHCDARHLNRRVRFSTAELSDVFARDAGNYNILVVNFRLS